MGKKIDPSISRRVYCPNLIRTLRKKPYQIAKTYMNSQEFAHSNRFICGKPVVTWCKLWCKLSAKSRLYAVILTYTPLISPAASLSGIKFCSLHPAPCRSVRVQNSHNTRFVKLFSFVLCPLVPSFSPQKL